MGTWGTVPAKTVKTTKLGVGGTTPAAQASKIADPSSGSTVDSQARTAINAIIDVLESFGLTASS